MDPWPLLARFVEVGRAIALPFAVATDAPLVFRRHRMGDERTLDAFGLPGPPPSAPRVTPDLVIAPVLAFDRHGSRLGQGAGCYDRTIALLRAAGPVWVVGLAFAGQEVDMLPIEDHDQRLDAILTEEGYRVF